MYNDFIFLYGLSLAYLAAGIFQVKELSYLDLQNG